MKADVDVTAGGETLPAVPVKTKGIAILGSHPATVDMAPFDDKDWLIWTCSPHNYEQRELPRFDAWFEIHVPVVHPTRCYRYLEFLKTVPLVWMRDKEAMKDYPGAQLYPEEEMVEEFGWPNFTSSIAYILALAITVAKANNIPQIGLFGIMQASETEYTYQRNGIQNMIWQADQRFRIKMVAPDISRLLDPPEEIF